MALNTVLLNQSEDQIVLSLISDKQYLLDRCHKELKQALSDFYQRDIQLLITPTDDKKKFSHSFILSKLSLSRV